jgi:hypothetical protein
MTSVRLPKLSQKPYIPKPARAKALTIAAAFQAQDGVVLCADSQMTVPFVLKYPAKKIIGFPKLRCKPHFTFAGREDFSKNAIKRLGRRIEQSEKAKTDILTNIEDECRKIHSEFYDVYALPEEKLELSILFTLYQDRFRTYKAQGPIVSEIDTCDFLGTGATVARATASQFYDPSMNVTKVWVMAAYCLLQAKTYADGCGDPSQIAVFWNTSAVQEPINISEKEIREIEKTFATIQKAITPVLLSCSDIDEPLSTFDRDLKKLSQTMRDEKRNTLAAAKRLIRLWQEASKRST